MELAILRETAGRLFDGNTVRFAFAELKDKENKPLLSMKIIVVERLTLFFFKKSDGKWHYDGWEMGDYNNYWTEENL